MNQIRLALLLMFWPFMANADSISGKQYVKSTGLYDKCWVQMVGGQYEYISEEKLNRLAALSWELADGDNVVAEMVKKEDIDATLAFMKTPGGRKLKDTIDDSGNCMEEKTIYRYIDVTSRAYLENVSPEEAKQAEAARIIKNLFNHSFVLNALARNLSVARAQKIIATPDAKNKYPEAYAEALKTAGEKASVPLTHQQSELVKKIDALLMY